MKNFKSIYNQYDHFYIDWDFHYKCNYNCSYCFQKWNNFLNTKKPNIKNIKIVSFFLKKINYEFTLGLLGGEPTLYEKEYFYILDFLKEIFQDKQESDCYVSTNCSKPIDFYKKHKHYTRIHQWISVHLEYFKEKDLDKYLHLKDITDKVIISPIIIPDFPNLNKILEKLYQFSIKNNFEYFPQFLYKNKSYDNFEFPYQNSYLYNQTKKEFIIDNKEFTLNEILLNQEKFNNLSFKNFICYPNYIYINPDNDLGFKCRNLNLNLNRDFKKCLNIKPKKIKCNFDFCKDFPKLLSEKNKKG